MQLKSAIDRLETKELEMDVRIASFAHQLSGALVSGDYAELFLLERAFVRNWQRRENVRDAIRCAQEALD